MESNRRALNTPRPLINCHGLSYGAKDNGLSHDPNFSMRAAISQYDIMGNLRHFVTLKVLTGFLRNFFYLVWW